MAEKKAYIVIAHSFRPEGQNTSMKDFGTKGKWTMVEDVYFVTRLRKKILGSFNHNFKSYRC